ncbi:hypothetical protein K0M31_012269, partial [Melipona bicolor]
TDESFDKTSPSSDRLVVWFRLSRLSQESLLPRSERIFSTLSPSFDAAARVHFDPPATALSIMDYIKSTKIGPPIGAIVDGRARRRTEGEESWGASCVTATSMLLSGWVDEPRSGELRIQRYFQRTAIKPGRSRSRPGEKLLACALLFELERILQPREEKGRESGEKRSRARHVPQRTDLDLERCAAIRTHTPNE